MSYCSHCKKNFSGNAAICPDCGQPFIEGLDHIGAEPAEELELLITAAGNFDTNRITSALKQAGVPFWKRYPGAGKDMHVIMGGGNTDVEIYVPVSMLPRALQALEDAGILQADANALPPSPDVDAFAPPAASRWSRIFLCGVIVVLAVAAILGGLKLGGL